MSKEILIDLSYEGEDDYIITVSGDKENQHKFINGFPETYDYIQKTEQLMKSVVGVKCVVHITPRLQKVYDAYKEYNTAKELFDFNHKKINKRTI